MIFLRFFKGWTEKVTPNSNEKCQIRDTITHFLASRNSEPDEADEADEPEMESGLAEQTLGTPHRGAG